MMQPISQIQPPTPARREEVPPTEPVHAATSTASGTDTPSDNKANTEERQKKRTAPDKPLSQDTLDEISRDLDTLHAVGLNFTQHEGTGRTMVRITNRDTDEVIREIPVKQVLDLAAKIEEMVGILFDEKV